MIGKRYNKIVSKTKQLLNSNEKPADLSNSSAPQPPPPVNFYPDFPDLVENHRDYFLGGAAYHTVKIGACPDQQRLRVAGNTPKSFTSSSGQNVMLRKTNSGGSTQSSSLQNSANVAISSFVQPTLIRGGTSSSFVAKDLLRRRVDGRSLSRSDIREEPVGSSRQSSEDVSSYYSDTTTSSNDDFAMKRRMFLSLSSNDVRGRKIRDQSAPPTVSAKSCVDVSGSQRGERRSARAQTLPRNFNDSKYSSRTSLSCDSDEDDEQYSDSDNETSISPRNKRHEKNSEEILHASRTLSKSMVQLGNKISSAATSHIEYPDKNMKPEAPPRSTSLKRIDVPMDEVERMEKETQTSVEILSDQPSEFRRNTYSRANNLTYSVAAGSSANQYPHSRADRSSYDYQGYPLSVTPTDINSLHANSLGKVSVSNSLHGESKVFNVSNNISDSVSSGQRIGNLHVDDNTDSKHNSETKSTWYSSYFAARKKHLNRNNTYKSSSSQDSEPSRNVPNSSRTTITESSKKTHESSGSETRDSLGDKIKFSPVPRRRTVFISRQDPARFSHTEERHYYAYSPHKELLRHHSEPHSWNTRTSRPCMPPSYETVVHISRLYRTLDEGRPL